MMRKKFRKIENFRFFGFSILRYKDIPTSSEAFLGCINMFLNAFIDLTRQKDFAVGIRSTCIDDE